MRHLNRSAALAPLLAAFALLVASAPKARAAPSLAGIWFAMEIDVSNGGMREVWRVFLPNGGVLQALPREGMRGFDPSTIRADSLGSYTASGASGQFRMRPIATPLAIAVKGPNEIAIGNTTYHRCPSVDGLRLEGSWSKGDKVPSVAAAGGRPVITFHKNGRFEATAQAAILGEAAGSGTYEFRESTLALKFDDGREKRVSMTGSLKADPRTLDGILYIGGIDFYEVE